MRYDVDVAKYGQWLLELSQIRMEICNGCLFLEYDEQYKEFTCILVHDIYEGFGKNNLCDDKVNLPAGLNAKEK